jgi:hypothetical protein
VIFIKDIFTTLTWIIRGQNYLSKDCPMGVANSHDELGIIFAQGFEGITEIEIGPEGYIYILSLYVSGGNC